MNSIRAEGEPLLSGFRVENNNNKVLIQHNLRHAERRNPAGKAAGGVQRFLMKE